MRYFILSLLSCLLPVHADSFSPPDVWATGTHDGKFIFVVVPAGFQDPEHPHPRTDPTIQKFLAENKLCVGALLEYSDQVNQYFPRWTRILVNRVAPSHALVSDDGSYVVTFGDWFGGYEDSLAVVIYDSNGDLIKGLSAKDILGEKAILEVPQTSHMILWGKPNRIDALNKQLILDVWQSGIPGTSDIKYREVAFNLKDGGLLDANRKP